VFRSVPTSLIEVGSVAERIELVPASTACEAIQDLFKANPRLRSVGVRSECDVWLVNRAVFHEQLSGPFDGGLTLPRWQTVAALERSLVGSFAADTPCEQVSDELIHGGHSLDDDVLVDYGDGTYGVVAVSALLCRLWDLSRRRAQDLEAVGRRFRAVVERSSDLTLMLDHDYQVVWSNRGHIDATSARAGNAPCAGSFMLSIDDDDHETVEELLARAKANPAGAQLGEFRFGPGPNDRRWYAASVRNFLSDPALGCVVVNLRDVEGQRQLRDHLVHQATTDALTGVGNRTSFFTELERRLLSEPNPVSLVMIDLDGFKDINDHFGHAIGDEVLRCVADRLVGHIRSADTVCRSGGDEFAIIVADGDQVGVVAKRLRALVCEPMVLAGAHVQVGASVGYVTATDELMSATQLAINVELAMYAAKHGGTARCVEFEPWMHDKEARQIEISDNLDLAVVDDEFFLMYQPQVRLESGHYVLHGFEALARWEDPIKGLISPAEFIPQAEQTGRIVEIGDWVLDEALRQLALWRRDDPDVQMAVNVSVRQLIEFQFASSVLKMLAKHRVPPSSLELEITETAMVADNETVATTLQTLREAGIGISVDDYGSGNASIAYLRRFPLTAIKADQELVALLDTEPAAATALLSSITSLAEALNLQSVAEGIETCRQSEAVRDIGFDLGQGYYFARPLTAEAAGKLIHAGAVDI